MQTRDADTRSRHDGGGSGPAKPVRVLLVDDHRLLLEAVGAALATSPEVTVAGCISDGAVLLEVADRLAWDVMVLDLFLPDHDGLDLLRQIKATHPSRGVLILTSASEEQFGLRAIRAGADGFLRKDAPLRDLVAAICVVAAGEVYATSVLARALAHAVAGGRRTGDPAALLSDRELEVVRLLAEGLSQKEIGARMRISRKTVHSHKANAQVKLGVDSTSLLIRYALDTGLVDRAERDATRRPNDASPPRP